MIKANELRRGNYIVFNDSIIPVLNIATDTPDCEGVYLTHKILIACGFEKFGRYAIGAGSYVTYRKGKIELIQQANGYPYILPMYEVKIKYLHQLQNLYFTLTGQELTINFD